MQSNIKYSAVLYFTILLIWSCTPKTGTTITTPPTPEPPSPPKQEPISPCQSFNNLSGYDRERAETAFVLYKDEMKYNRLPEALQHWRIAYQLAPGSNGKVKYHFDDGVSIFKSMFDQTTDTKLKKLYVDTVMMIYDKRKECFGDEAYVNGLKGFDYFYYYPDYTSEAHIYDLLKSNFDVKGVDADYFVINPFTRLLYNGVINGSVSLEEGRKYALLIDKAIKKGVATCKGQACDTWAVIQDYAPDRLEALEGIDNFYECEYYASKYYELFKAYPDSCEIINMAYARMLRGDCPVSDTRLVEVKKAKDTKCYVAPPQISCAAQGNSYYSDGKYTKAIQSYDECIAQSNDSETKAKYLLLIAKIYYRDLRNFPKSRQYALDAAKQKPNWGAPYILIGNLYASSGPLCGTGRGWESQVVTWPAIDMWNKAKSIDGSVTSEANTLINRYTQFMPKKEDIFFRGIKAGESYFVPCWIQENTVVRTAD